MGESAAAIEGGVGLVHTGGQASFHGGDGRGGLLDYTALDAVLPVVLQPHDGIWDYVPTLDEGTARTTLGIALDGFSVPLFHRTTARPDAVVHATIDGGRYPLLVTGRHGRGLTAVFAAGLVKPLRKFGVEFRDPLEVEPPWARDDIRRYSPYWRGTLQLALGLLAAATGHELPEPAYVLAERLRKPLFEQLADLSQTSLAAHILHAERDGGRVPGRSRSPTRGRSPAAGPRGRRGGWNVRPPLPRRVRRPAAGRVGRAAIRGRRGVRRRSCAPCSAERDTSEGRRPPGSLQPRTRSRSMRPVKILPTTVVGSYAQPEWLIDRERLGSRLPPRVRATELWRVDPQYLEQAQDDATRLAVLDMERAGVDIITDGEIRRESYSNRFATALENVDIDNPGSAINRTGHPNPVPRVVGPIRRRGPVEVRDVEFLRSLTTLPTKSHSPARSQWPSRPRTTTTTMRSSWPSPTPQR